MFAASSSAALVALDEPLGLKAAGSGWSAVESGCISTVEVVMRPPSVFVRPLLHEEAVRLKRLSRRAKHESTRQRAAGVVGLERSDVGAADR